RNRPWQPHLREQQTQNEERPDRVRFRALAEASSSRRLEYTARIATVLRRACMVPEVFLLQEARAHPYFYVFRRRELSGTRLVEWEKSRRARRWIHAIRC